MAVYMFFSDRLPLTFQVGRYTWAATLLVRESSEIDIIFINIELSNYFLLYVVFICSFKSIAMQSYPFLFSVIL
ncbi:hypothetical protein Xszus_03950 [Xenorhabdus szentirmaii]|uniref:Uncharacterized protein n=1 Tax=Xenorhabdus szentirmaii DSM 16338 TaxID=1427518 RepID=W1J6R7_9GAMM|nr:hypothetical protein Xsze_01790 [Xenorhabdus szentirmaii DSM 16338]PHM44126.1 hypothetical protein Xszus_03950 [Xenorhabdus szentirmaii]CDL85556.1 hypothetical protein XSR1_80056 [Xenorhabdus szentirmaii DSM 16338]